jgi:hypothetical protein
MKITLANYSLYKYLRDFSRKKCGSWSFGIHQVRFIFKPNKKIIIHPPDENIGLDNY